MSSDHYSIDPEQLLADHGWAYGLARSLARDASAADDLVQETWLAALKASWPGGSPPRSWLAEVMRNFARMRYRSEARGRDLVRVGAVRTLVKTTP